MDIASINSGIATAQALQQKGGVGPLGEIPTEVAQSFEAAPQNVTPTAQLGVAGNGDAEGSRSGANTRDEGPAPTYSAAGQMGGSGQDEGSLGGRLNVTA